MQAEGSSATPLGVRSNALAALMQPTRGQPPGAAAVRSVAAKRRAAILQTAPDDSFSRQREQELFEGAYPVAADMMLKHCEASTKVLLPLSTRGEHQCASAHVHQWGCTPDCRRAAKSFFESQNKYKTLNSSNQCTEICPSRHVWMFNLRILQTHEACTRPPAKVDTGMYCCKRSVLWH